MTNRPPDCAFNREFRKKKEEEKMLLVVKK